MIKRHFLPVCCGTGLLLAGLWLLDRQPAAESPPGDQRPAASWNRTSARSSQPHPGGLRASGELPSTPAPAPLRHAAATTVEFREWLADQAMPPDSAALAAGRRLLEKRRAAMVRLIRRDPAAALQQALSYAERERLPGDWSVLLEERISTVAEVAVLSAVGGGDTERLVVKRPGQRPLQGVGWAGLAGLQSKTRLPVEGIALDGWVALAATGVHGVRGGELCAVEKIFPPAPSCGDVPPAAAPEGALIGGRVHRFSAAGAMDHLVGLAAKVARMPGPAGANALIAALGGAAPLPGDDILRGAGEAASAWTETPKSVLVLRPAFADRTNNLGTRSQWEATMAEVSAWLSANSYGKTNLVVTVVNRPDIMVIGSAAVYEPTEDYARLMADSKERALLAGFNADNYDITVVAFPKLSWSWSGLATIGGRDQWLNGTREAKTIAHEFGHNYGLRHASSWDVDDGSVMPATGAPDAGDPRHAEYGDRFSVMGSNPGDYPQGDFSTHGKAFLNWISAGQVATVTAPGTYRVHRFDAPGAGSKPTLALKLQRADSQVFWLGYRRSFTANSYLSNGAYLLWEYTPEQCRLLDLTPDSRITSHYDDKEDAALAMGQTFADPTGNLYLTPLAQGGSAPDEWLDVRVEFTAGGNEPPTAAINLPPAPVAARAPVVFSATASDPDDDPLEYHWDFGYGRTASGASVNWTFTVGGSRQVKLTVSDGRGGTAVVTETVLVSDPLTEIEGVPLPVAVQLDDGALASGLQVAVSPTWPLASPDGEVWSVGPAALGFSPERLAAGGGRFVAVGGYYDGAAAKWLAKTAASIDGLAWESVAPAMLPPLKSVAFRNGVFVAVGDDAAVAYGTDGLGWTAAVGIPAESFRDVVATGTGFVACGTGGTVLTSQDGVVWTPRATPLAWPALSGLATDGAAVACVGMGPSYWWSADGGATWSSREFGLAGFNPTMTSHGEGLWIAAENRYVPASSSYLLVMAVSTDGAVWEPLPALATAVDTESVRIADGRLWLYGQTGILLRSTLLPTANQAPEITPQWPADAVARTAVSFSATATDADGDPVELLWNLDGAGYRFGSPVSQRFLLGGTKEFSVWAADGRGSHTLATHTGTVADPLLVWSNITPAAWGAHHPRNGVCDGAQAVLAGQYAAAVAPANEASDGTAWTFHELPLFTFGTAWRGPGFVAVGQLYDINLQAWRGSVSRSVDGRSWAAGEFVGTRPLYAVAAAADAYVAVGAAGVIFRSADGQQWTPAASGTGVALRHAAFAGARGLVSGDGGVLLRSEDSGATWENVTTTLGQGLAPSGVFAAAGSLFIAASNKLRLYHPATRVWQDAVIHGPLPGAIQSLVSHDGLLVAAALRYDAGLDRNLRFLLVSEDGLRWEAGEMDWGADIGVLLDCGGDLIASGSGTLLANTAGTNGLLVEPAFLAAAMGSTETGALGTATIRNTGSDDLSWTASSGAAWLDVVPSSGTATASPETLTARLRQAMPPGTYQGTLVFTAPGVPARELAVTLTTFADDYGSIKANAFPISPGAPVSGVIQHADDADWFVFDLDAPGTLTVWTTGTLDTLGELQDAVGMIDRKDDSATDANFVMVNAVEAGRYWVRVDGFGNDTGSYQLHISLLPPGQPVALKSWGLAPGGTEWAFVVATIPGYRYFVQHSYDLAGDWLPAGGMATASTGETVLLVPTAGREGPRGFFRIAALPPQP